MIIEILQEACVLVALSLFIAAIALWAVIIGVLVQ